MPLPREIIEGVQVQGINESIPWELDVSAQGTDPTPGTVVVTDRAGEDVTEDVLSGTPIATDPGVFYFGTLHDLMLEGEEYRIAIPYTINGAELEAYMIVLPEA